MIVIFLIDLLKNCLQSGLFIKVEEYYIPIYVTIIYF